jgi:threonine synthase
MAGVESISGELTGQCESTIDHVFVPVGGGGLFTAVCRGFAKQSGALPRVHAIQPEGCSTVIAAWDRGDDQIRPVISTTRISGLAVPFDVDAGLALQQLRRFHGYGFAVSDVEVFEAQRIMLEQEGIYAEPAGAAALAGLCKAARKGLVSRDETAICLVTGHGFKDQDSMLKVGARHPSALIDECEVEIALSGIIPSCP